MNQNILVGLERQAEKLVLQIPAALDSNEYTSLFNEKFAELIVRECAERLLNDVKLTDIRTSRCVASINEHFGVGE